MVQDSDGNEPDDFLSQALAWSGLEGRLWRRQELAAILQHQLDAALTSDLARSSQGGRRLPRTSVPVSNRRSRRSGICSIIPTRR